MHSRLYSSEEWVNKPNKNIWISIKDEWDGSNWVIVFKIESEVKRFIKVLWKQIRESKTILYKSHIKREIKKIKLKLTQFGYH